MRTVLLTLAASSILIGCSSRPASPAITHDELVRRAQELFDSVAGGDATPWKKYFADDCLFFDEKGRSMNKEALVKDIAPLPTGYSGSIKIVGAQSRTFADAAVISYDLDETEIVFGQVLKARYHTTDTWLLRNGRWQIIAEDRKSTRLNSSHLVISYAVFCLKK